MISFYTKYNVENSHEAFFKVNFIFGLKNEGLEVPICIKERAGEYTAQNLRFQVSSFVATAKISTEGSIGTIGGKRVSFGDVSADLRKRGATVNREPYWKKIYKARCLEL